VRKRGERKNEKIFHTLFLRAEKEKKAPYLRIYQLPPHPSKLGFKEGREKEKEDALPNLSSTPKKKKGGRKLYTILRISVDDRLGTAERRGKRPLRKRD